MFLKPNSTAPGDVDDEVMLLMCRESTELMLTVIQGRDLERDHVTGSLDSYVRVSLTPFTGSRSQTRVVKFICLFVN